MKNQHKHNHDKKKGINNIKEIHQQSIAQLVRKEKKSVDHHSSDGSSKVG